MLKKLALALAITVSIVGGAAAQQMENPDTIVVFDASNSMWGQIDGVSKVEIAREVVADLLVDLETSSDFGLLAYGHRRKSDCSDIELILPVGPLNTDEFSAAVNSLSPRGRTPLTDAVRQAAEILNFEGRSGRIVLISDGIESCDADPCALARELAQSGLDFTTHVIGFDVSNVADQSQLSCLAEITGGLYLTAESTQELGDALMTMMSDPDTLTVEVGPTITLRAVTTEGVQIFDPAIVWNIDHVPSGDNWLTNEIGGTVTVEYQADEYIARANLGTLSGSLEFTFDGDESAVFDVVLMQEYAVDAPNVVDALASFDVTWTGVELDGDYIALAHPADELGTFSSYSRTSTSNPVTLQAPAEAGTYEVRYISAITGELLATDVVTVEKISISLNAPVEVKTGDQFDVNWQGTTSEGDTLALIPLDATLNDAVFSAPATDSAMATLTAPNFAGVYTVLYLDSAGNTLSQANISVYYEATLNTVETTIAGSRIDIEWTGPNLPDDYITIVAQGAADGTYLNWSYARDGSPASVLTSDVAGDYEIRYGTDLSNRISARRAITLTPATATISVTDTATSGALIEVVWTGNAFEGDYITIVPVDAGNSEYLDYSNLTEGSPLQLQAPDAEGAFEVRYITGPSNLVLARAPVQLSRMDVSLTAPDQAVAGSEISVVWQGPNNPSDYLTVVAVGASATSYNQYVYTTDGSPVSLQTPDETGAFELRYVSGGDGGVLAAIPITLTDAGVALNAVSTAIAGSAVSVTWVGPGNTGDYITIVAADANEGKYGKYTYTRDGSPLDVIAADNPGDYEIRYVSGQSNATLARLPLTLTAPEIALQAVSQAVAGASIDVTWAGPDNQGDYITMVEVGARDSDYGNYTYTRDGSPLTITAEDTAGDYEVRYVSGQSQVVLIRVPITLTQPEVAIIAESQVVAGGDVSVIWLGPDNKSDYITIVPVGADERETGPYTYTGRGSPLTVKAPETPGEYEIRYLSGQSRDTWASVSLTVVAE